MSERRLGLTANSSFPCRSAMRALAVSTSRMVRPRRSRRERRFCPAVRMAILPSGASIRSPGSARSHASFEAHFTTDKILSPKVSRSFLGSGPRPLQSRTRIRATQRTITQSLFPCKRTFIQAKNCDPSDRFFERPPLVIATSLGDCPKAQIGLWLAIIGSWHGGGKANRWRSNRLPPPPRPKQNNDLPRSRLLRGRKKRLLSCPAGESSNNFNRRKIRAIAKCSRAPCPIWIPN